jgi:hypothetical protein
MAADDETKKVVEHPHSPEARAAREAAAAVAASDARVAERIAAGQKARGFRRFVRVYHQHMPHEPRRERLFLSSAAFFLTIIGLRLLTAAIRFNIGPFHNVTVGGTHVHHLVWGILLLLLVGYLWLVEFGTRDPSSDIASRLSAIVFGFAAALTLDEFALWLNLSDNYWTSRGARQSIEAILAFFALLTAAFWGAPLLHGLYHEMRAMVREFRRVEEDVEERVRHSES